MYCQQLCACNKIKLPESDFCKIKVICWDMAQREITTANDGFICVHLLSFSFFQYPSPKELGLGVHVLVCNVHINSI
jgi:hypothetical protein